MTSKRRSTANGHNAQKSTGPRTVKGKARSSRNAFRHGLSVGTVFDSETEKRIQRLTALIANGASGDFASFIDEQALALAQAEIVSSQIRAMRILQLESQVSEGESMSAMARIKNREHLRRALPLLLSMERYEERASSRGRTAIRNLCHVGHTIENA